MNPGLRKIRLVVADDHPVVRHGLINLLSTEMEITIVAICANGAECIAAIRKHAPDIALVDMVMPVMGGLDVLAAAQAEKLPTRIVLLAGAPADAEIVGAASGGAFGFIVKDAAPDELLSCLHAVSRGERWLPAELIEKAQARETERQSECALIDTTLSRREREVMLLIGESLSNKETGQRLRLSEGTVKLHLHSIYSKLGLRNRTALAALAAKYERAGGAPPRPASSPPGQDRKPAPAGKTGPGRPER